MREHFGEQVDVDWVKIRPLGLPVVRNGFKQKIGSVK